MSTFLTVIFRACLLTLLGVFLLTGQNKNFSKTNDTASRIDSTRSQQALCNINNWSYWVYKDGATGISPEGNGGGIYPRFTSNVLYKDGLLWGARVDGQVILGGQQYRDGTRALLDQVYGVRIDWPVISAYDLQQEAYELFGYNNNTYDKRDVVKKRYQDAWKNWPVDKGAPYVDVDGNGVYNPVLNDLGYPDASKGDYPGMHGADQVIWLAVDDQDSLKMDSLYHGKPAGIREEITIWAYDRPDSALGQTIFKKYKITNISKSTVFKEMYLGQWADPDIGDYINDFIGCDSLQNSCFAYNGTKDDHEFLDFGISPAPVMGYVLLQGPVIPSAGDTAVVDFKNVPGYKNLPMTAFCDVPPLNVDDPDPNPAEMKQIWYNRFRGNKPTIDIDNPIPITHKSGKYKGQPTKYPLNGNPLAGIGDLDGQGDNNPAGDRSLCLVSGPFDLHPGESQEMVVALIGGKKKNTKPPLQVFADNVKKITQKYPTLNVLDHQNLQSIYAHLPYYIPKTMYLKQNYPNPFNPRTHIAYGLPSPGRVQLSVYSLTGQKVRTLINGWQEAGTYIADFDGSGLASALYMYRLQIGGHVQTRKMILLK